ncbi:ABC transporter ATP-binding protein [Bordetella genomosp. 9]|uniref:ABC transporter n=1 Tax=Bordetella genomosp. 9 TaxID=1416803 RepID=A0A1W6Z5N0_9BORD|nr:ABC transporter ATP-binding protein [Bordetella genomosp. 9]ARP88670.1 ABC transporter [Bordetella genomosp. 9]ARP92645.1 ABC transporter [Bordetella genomosp. 9]
MNPGTLPSRPLAFLFRYVRARPVSFGCLALLIVSAASCAVLVQYGMKLIVDAMSAADRQAADIWHPLAYFLGLIALESALWRGGGWLGCRTIVASCADMRIDLFDHLTGHSLPFFKRHLTGSLGNRISATSTASSIIYGTLTWNVMPPCVEFIGATVVLLSIDWRLALALMAFVALVASVIVLFGVRGRQLHETYGMHASRVGGEIVDTVSNIWAVQAFAARSRESDRLKWQVQQEARAQRRSWMYLEKARVMHDICLWIMAGSMLCWALYAWRREAMSTGDVVVVSALAFRILHGSRDLALALVGTAQQFGVIAEMLSVVAQPHGMADRPDARPYRPAGGEIEFNNVDYAYPDGHVVFRGLNLRIPAGQKVGIVGPSGAGKSTLLTLLQRLDDVTAGAIVLDGQPITALTRDSLRQAISVVPQEVPLFRRTIMENIRYGRPDATDEEVYEAARLANCEEFIEQLPDGYQTLLVERGASLSGGQRQRLSMARAFLKNAPILILDEATSSLDSRSEERVQQALAGLMRNRTVLAAAHRLSTLSRFDRIIVLDEGRIVEDGTPDALRARDGLFSKLWRMQSQEAPLEESLSAR